MPQDARAVADNPDCPPQPLRTGRGAGSSRRARQSWREERARLVLAICLHIQARTLAGHSEAREIRRAAKRWNGRPYRKSPDRKLRLSEPTLTRLFYGWKKRGTDALVLNYKAGTPKMPAAVVQDFLRACLDEGVHSMAEAIRAIQVIWRERYGEGCPYSVECFYRRVPKGLRGVIADLHRGRRENFRKAEKLRTEITHG